MKLNEKLKQHSVEITLYPPRFHVIISRDNEAAKDLNFFLKIDNAKPDVSFHIGSLSGIKKLNSCIIRLQYIP